MDTDKLGIPTGRRVAGVAFLPLFCLAGLLYLAAPGWMAAALPDLINPTYVGLFMLVGTALSWPTLFYPCLFDRFPQWVLRHPRVARRAAARLGVSLPTTAAQQV